ncbi:MAG TPA: Hsp20/alpha crystallin family protein [Stellaceae bacterium]|nr:Hsp20/alpha crystallin family protein [Stellaceae bacterium]
MEQKLQRHSPENWRVAREARESDPFLRLHHDINRLFQEMLGGFTLPGLGRSLEGGVSGAMLSPRIELSESEEEFRIAAELPGIEEKDIDVTLDRNTLTLHAEKKIETDSKEANYHVTERAYGTYRRQIELPFAPDPDQIHATFKNGTLHITLPKPKEIRQRTRRIEVKGESSPEAQRGKTQRLGSGSRPQQEKDRPQEKESTHETTGEHRR